MIPGKALSKRIFQSTIWAFLIPLSTRFISLIRTIILAKLLAPADFGTFGIAIVIIYFFETMTAFSLPDALIQKKQETKDQLDTVWTFQIIKGFLLAFITFIFSYKISKFFAEPKLIYIIPMICITYILRGFTNIGIIQLQKELEFHKRFIYINIGAFADIIISICLAFILRNYWALIGGYIISELILAIASYLIVPYRPKIQFNFIIIKDLFNFGVWLWATSMISFAIVRIDKLIIAKVIGTTALGYYMMANKFADITAVNIGKALSSVMFPAYSKVQDEISLLKKGFLTSLEFVLLISLPVSAILIILAPEFTTIILGRKWMPCVKSMQILTAASFIRALMLVYISLFRGVAKTKWEFILALMRAIIIIATVVFLTNIWGIEGTSISILLGVLLTAPFGIYLSVRIVRTNSKEIIMKILPIVFGVVSMSIIMIAFKVYISIKQIDYLIITIIISLIFFILPLIIYWRIFNCGPIPTILHYLKSFAKK
jgi:O-antigen/teichoic acid export membrane protein